MSVWIIEISLMVIGGIGGILLWFANQIYNEVKKIPQIHTDVELLKQRLEHFERCKNFEI